jgi:hypothetical protein
VAAFEQAVHGVAEGGEGSGHGGMVARRMRAFRASSLWGGARGAMLHGSAR